jgi:hypothetical protein
LVGCREAVDRLDVGIPREDKGTPEADKGGRATGEAAGEASLLLPVREQADFCYAKSDVTYSQYGAEILHYRFFLKSVLLFLKVIIIDPHILYSFNFSRSRYFFSFGFSRCI